MNKALAIAAALLLTAGGTVWAAVSLPSAPLPKEAKVETVVAEKGRPGAPQSETMRRRRGGHICGTRFCGSHCHHHGHVWCDGHNHWYCPGHH